MTSLLILADATLLAALALVYSQQKRINKLKQRISILAGVGLASSSEADKLDNIGKLARSIDHLAQKKSHSFQLQRTLTAATLSRLKIFLSILRSDLGGHIGIKIIAEEVIQKFSEEIDYFDSLARQIESLTLLESSTLDTLDVRHVLTETVRWTSKNLDATKIAVSLDLPSDPIILRCNKLHLRYLTKNLLENALRCTVNGSRVHINCVQLHGLIVISFDDSLPRTRQYKIGKIISSSHDVIDDSYELGLLICQCIAEAHGGGMTITNSPIGGLSVTVQLPVAK